jgi:hypothetical protein
MASVNDEIGKVLGTADSLIREYVAWSEKITIGESQNLVYSGIIEFVDFRIETASSCLYLIEKDRIADALGLCRALLEHYMLLILMCRGRKYFSIVKLDSKTPEEFAEYFKEQQANLIEMQRTGEADALYIAKYPRAKRCLMYVFEGLTDPDDSDFFIPAHYFQFKDSFQKHCGSTRRSISNITLPVRANDECRKIGDVRLMVSTVSIYLTTHSACV